MATKAEGRGRAVRSRVAPCAAAKGTKARRGFLLLKASRGDSLSAAELAELVGKPVHLIEAGLEAAAVADRAAARLSPDEAKAHLAELAADPYARPADVAAAKSYLGPLLGASAPAAEAAVSAG